MRTIHEAHDDNLRRQADGYGGYGRQNPYRGMGVQEGGPPPRSIQEPTSDVTWYENNAGLTIKQLVDKIGQLEQRVDQDYGRIIKLADRVDQLERRLEGPSGTSGYEG